MSTPQKSGKYSVEGYSAFQGLYKDESDRAVVILAGSYLERYLEEVLGSVLVSHKSTKDLFEGYGPLSTFAAKIDICFSIGIIPVHIRDELHQIRRIRNWCAHHDGDVAFADQRISDMCTRLMPGSGIRQTDGGLFKQQSSREQFLFSIWWALIHLETQWERCSRIPELKLQFRVDADCGARPASSSEHESCTSNDT